MQPVIFITTDRRDGGPPTAGSRRVRPKRSEVWIGELYVEAVRTAGGIPLLVPPGASNTDELLEMCDGVLLTGGHFDIHPEWYGQAVVARLDRVEKARTAVEIALAKGCLSRGIPVLGVCGGMQALAVAAGGQLIQDIGTQVGSRIDHEQLSDPAEPWHKVRFTEAAHSIFGPVAHVNSTHHQAVADPGSLMVVGRSDDGLIEAIMGEPDEAFALGVQWHPELLGDIRPYQALIDATHSEPHRP
ncbi:MAG: gamma-glutamyl-gamma-aminobutyrate hydrolase family protein [Myxococcota bacterium]